MNALNNQLFLAVNGLAGHVWFFDGLNRIIAVAAPWFFAVVLVALFARGARQLALDAGYSAVLGLAINFAIAAVYFHPGPFMLGLGKTLIHHGPETSFPSDHATLAFAVAFAVLLSPLRGRLRPKAAKTRRRRLGTVLLFGAIFTGFSRVYVGVHFPLDIAGSCGVGLAAAGIERRIRTRLVPLNRVISRTYDAIALNRFAKGSR